MENIVKKYFEDLGLVNKDNIIAPDVLRITEFNQENACTETTWMVNFDKFIVDEDGTITCKASEQALNTLETQSLPVCLLWESDLDGQLIGEDGCLSNFDMYTPIYLQRFNCVYLVPHSTSFKFAKGEEVKIYPRETTLEELDEFLGWAYNH